MHTITGNGDLLCRVVARSNADLQRVIDQVVATDGVGRTSTVIALATQVGHRVMPLVHAAAASSSPDRRRTPTPSPHSGRERHVARTTGATVTPAAGAVPGLRGRSRYRGPVGSRERSYRLPRTADDRTPH